MLPRRGLSVLTETLDPSLAEVTRIYILWSFWQSWHLRAAVTALRVYSKYWRGKGVLERERNEEEVKRGYFEESMAVKVGNQDSRLFTE